MYFSEKKPPRRIPHATEMASEDLRASWVTGLPEPVKQTWTLDSEASSMSVQHLMGACQL